MDPLEKLRIADPETHTWVKGRVTLMDPPPSPALLDRMVDEIIWALSQEPGLGQTLAQGLLRLAAFSSGEKIPAYLQMVHEAARTGPTLARLLATHLVAVFKADHLLEPFNSLLRVMLGKGTYTLNEPLAVLTELLDSGDPPSAEAFIDLLADTFSQEITYNHSVRLVYVLPGTVRHLPPRRRAAQIRALGRVARTDLNLLDPFIEGLQKGLAMLGPPDLEIFVDQALDLYLRNKASGSAFLSLTAKLGQSVFAGLQTTVALNDIKGQLDRYLNARLNRGVGIKPIAEADLEGVQDIWVYSDGRFIHLPDEIDRFDGQAMNMAAAKAWVRLEAGWFEWGTFDFDLERAADLYPVVAGRVREHPAPGDDALCDAERFFEDFDHPALAEDLFGLFEHARVMALTAGRYPGLVTQTLPILEEEVRALGQLGRWRHPLCPLYERLAMHRLTKAQPQPQSGDLYLRIERLFRMHITEHSPVEASADLVCRVYEAAKSAWARPSQAYAPMSPPFGRRLRWHLVRAAFTAQAPMTRRIKLKLDQQGLKVYRSDLQKRLDRQQGRISADDIQTLVLMRGNNGAPSLPVQVDWSQVDLSAIFEAAGVEPAQLDVSDAEAFFYPEWDGQLQDYLQHHARVQETVVTADGNGHFYRETLERHRGLVSRMRRAFEHLKPEGLVILRQWPEGDAFDYRALLDFAIDLKAGRIPSDCLFIKRLKQERDVTVQLLVDLSRSTANPVVGGQESVLDVAKQALVLFCEALQVVGDTYAIAGFSGTGRHSVDYFRIKDFETPLDPVVQARISALRPQRSTRMGAAIRHATAQLAAAPSRVRLLIVVSDGFPNDLGYKAEYAIADTRRAVQEARTRSVHVKAITVNIGSDPRLDDLYGRMHHHVIGDVRELPDKLLRLYGTLTRRL